MEALGPLMLGGMVLGGVGTAIVDATKGVGDSCSALQAARDKLKKEQNAWNKAMGEVTVDSAALKLSQQQMVTLTSELKLATGNYHRIFTNKQHAIDAGIVIFLLGIVIMLVMKRIDLWGKIVAIF